MLAERFGWHPLDVEDIVSKRQRPKVDDYEDDGYLFVVLHFPVYDKPIQRLNAAELDVFIGPDYLVTIPNRELLPVTRLFAPLRERRRAARSSSSRRAPAGFSTRCSTTCSTTASRSSTRSATSSTSIEDEMFEGHAEDVVQDISNVEAGDHLVPQGDQARPLDAAAARAPTSTRFLPEELDLYFDDIVDAAERIWDSSTTTRKSSTALESTNESVISHRQNDVLRVLTIFSVILLPLTLISGIFGMNVAFPGEGTHVALLARDRPDVATIVGMFGFFRLKRWL